MLLTERIEKELNGNSHAEQFLLAARYYDSGLYQEAKKEFPPNSINGSTGNLRSIANFMEASINYHISLRLGKSNPPFSQIRDGFYRAIDEYISKIKSGKIIGFEEEIRMDIADGRKYTMLLEEVNTPKGYILMFSSRIDELESCLPKKTYSGINGRFHQVSAILGHISDNLKKALKAS